MVKFYYLFIATQVLTVSRTPGLIACLKLKRRPVYNSFWISNYSFQYVILFKITCYSQNIPVINGKRDLHFPPWEGTPSRSIYSWRCQDNVWWLVTNVRVSCYVKWLDFRGVIDAVGWLSEGKAAQEWKLSLLTFSSMNYQWNRTKVFKGILIALRPWNLKIS